MTITIPDTDLDELVDRAARCMVGRETAIRQGLHSAIVRTWRNTERKARANTLPIVKKIYGFDAGFAYVKMELLIVNRAEEIYALEMGIDLKRIGF